MFKGLFRWISLFWAWFAGQEFFLAAYLLTADPCDIKDFRDVVVYPWCRMHSSNPGLIFFILSSHAQKGSEKFAQELDVSLKSTASRTDLRNDRTGARSFDRF